MNVNYYRPPIKRIPDELWDEIKRVLPKEKSPKTVGRPIVPYRKVMDGILYVLRTGCQWKMLPKEHGSGSTCHSLEMKIKSYNLIGFWDRLLIKNYTDILFYC